MSPLMLCLIATALFVSTSSAWRFIAVTPSGTANGTCSGTTVLVDVLGNSGQCYSAPSSVTSGSWRIVDNDNCNTTTSGYWCLRTWSPGTDCTLNGGGFSRSASTVYGNGFDAPVGFFGTSQTTAFCFTVRASAAFVAPALALLALMALVM